MSRSLAEGIELAIDESYNDYKANRGTEVGAISNLARMVGLLALALDELYIPNPADGMETVDAATVIAAAITEAGRMMHP